MLSITRKSLFFKCLSFAICLYCSPVFSLSKEAVDKSPKALLESAELMLKSDVGLTFDLLSKIEAQLTLLSIEQKLKYYYLLSESYSTSGQFISAAQTLDTALTLAKKLASPSVIICDLLYLRGYAAESLGDTSLAVEYYKKGLEVAESLHDKVMIANGLINLGAIAYITDDYKRALILLNDAYKIAAQTNDDQLKGYSNVELGIAYANLGQNEQSMVYYKQAYEYFKKSGMLLAAHNALNNIAMNYSVNKQYNEAISAYQEIISTSNEHSPAEIMYRVFSGMAWAQFRKEESDPEKAYEYFLKAEKYIDTIQRHDIKLQFYFDQAFVLFHLKRYQDTLVSIAEAEKLLVNHDSLPFFQKQANLGIINLKSKVYYEQKRFKEAYEAKSKLVFLREQLHENEDKKSVAEVRLSLESEQADLKNKLLENEKTINQENLAEAQFANKEQQLYLSIGALVALALAWILAKLLYSQRQLKLASTIDTLTGIENRRSLMKKSAQAFKLAKKKHHCFSVLVIDIDRFKNINDTLGHSQGDVVLKEVVQLSESMMRKSDVFGRLGGEEFMVCLPKQDLQSAIYIAERIRERIAEKQWPLRNITQVTVSIGVASLASDSDLNTLVQRADKLLYKAKLSGRNKVCSS
ncbi:tetratricopeptide repeat-containing diguanylate cyclase [Colwellia asteriadis]|uniref:tetratricopeptide repeat-containing diguanylate cyclase n=1 Tax=Colwellia asteriadis TaxID=517723 RepID=UPI0031DEEDCF